MSFSVNVQLGLWADDLRMGLKQALLIIKPLQVEAIGLDAFSTELSPRTLGASARRDVAQLIRSRGAALAAMRADVGGRRLADPQALDVNLSRIREALQLASELGAAHLVVPGGYIPALTENEASARAALTEAGRTLAGLASASRTRVSWLGGQEAPEVLAEFLNSVDSSGMLGVDLNPGAYLMRGIDPLKALNALAPRVTLARAADHYRGGAEAPFGSGDVRWGELMIGLATLKRPSPIPVLTACSLEGERATILAKAYSRLLALRKNPMS